MFYNPHPDSGEADTPPENDPFQNESRHTIVTAVAREVLTKLDAVVASPSSATAGVATSRVAATPATGAGGAPTVASTRQALAATTPSPAAVIKGKADPCLLITKAEIEAALGFALHDPQAEGDAGGATCIYTGGADNPAVTFAVGVSFGASKTSFEQLRTITTSAAKGAGPDFAVTDVPGVGEAAFKGPGPSINALKGSTVILLNAGVGEGILSSDKLIDLAKIAVGRA